MSRLATELDRLYRADTHDHTRTLVLELAGPADWSLLSAVWQGVQAELGLPAPGIAVSGTEGMQLWFSLAQPVSLAQGHAFLDALRQRYLPGVAAARVRLLPAADEAAAPMPRVPALQPDTGNWSAFVAPDLAPLFSETPWLDVPPGDEAQASLLGRLASIDARAFDAAWAQLQAPPAAAAEPTMTVRDDGGDSSAQVEALRFLRSVMNDAAAPLALRIEAAKALLLPQAAPSTLPHA